MTMLGIFSTAVKPLPRPAEAFRDFPGNSLCSFRAEIAYGGQASYDASHEPRNITSHSLVHTDRPASPQGTLLQSEHGKQVCVCMRVRVCVSVTSTFMRGDTIPLHVLWAPLIKQWRCTLSWCSGCLLQRGLYPFCEAYIYLVTAWKILTDFFFKELPPYQKERGAYELIL